jgi:hypothetical protein
MKRFAFLLALSFALVSCGPDRPASTGDAPPAVSVVDTALIKATKALALAELTYEPIAATALKLIQGGQIKGATAATVRDLNRTVTDAFRVAKASQNAAVITTELAKAKSASTALGAIVKAFE